jgi:alpha-beta hydrolase superfamily lysophospholipase
MSFPVPQPIPGALMDTPDRPIESDCELKVLRAGRLKWIRFEELRLPCWSWGQGQARLLLVHGWGARACQLSNFVAPLVAAGFEVVAFDAPGHGIASGCRTSLAEQTRALRMVARETGRPDAIVAFGTGSLVALHALRGGMTARCSVHLSPDAMGPSRAELNPLLQEVRHPALVIDADSPVGPAGPLAKSGRVLFIELSGARANGVLKSRRAARLTREFVSNHTLRSR